MTDRPTAEERARAIINNGEYLFAIDQIREAEAAAEQRGAERGRANAYIGLKVALDTLKSVRIFVTSRQRIKEPEGEEWYDEAIASVEQAIRDKYCPPSEEG